MSYNESLSANSNYPAMTQSQWDNAPFNEPAPPEPVDVSCDVSISLFHENVMLNTDKYTIDGGEDEEGHWIETREFESCDLIEALNESELHPLNLLAEYREILKDKLSNLEKEMVILDAQYEKEHTVKYASALRRAEKTRREYILKIAMCENWEVTDIHVEEE